MAISAYQNPAEGVSQATSGSRRFGDPCVECAVLTTELPLPECIAPEALHRATRQQGRVLFASREGGQQSLVVTRAPLRLRVRDRVARVELLELSCGPLLNELQKRMPGSQRNGLELTVAVPSPSGEPAVLDRERLQEPSLFDPVRVLVGLVGDRVPAPMPVGVFGAFAFDLVDHFEALGERRADPCGDADLEVVLGLDLVRYDHQEGVVHVVTRGLPWESVSAVQQRHQRIVAELQSGAEVAHQNAAAAAATCGPRRVEQPDDAFLHGVAALREHIAAGDIFQTVLSRAVSWECTADSLDVFERLAENEPAPYAFHMQLARGALFGCSPETCVRVADGEVEIRPIAGTTRRSADPDTDERLALALLFDRKERAEHVMLLDLARNDVARVSEAGTTAVVQQFAVEKYSRVQHLVSRVRGTLRSELDALHAYRSAANMGTLSGAPKPRAMELVRKLEPAGRGFYGGAVGYLLADGQFDSCIAIRSVRMLDGVYRAQAGAGIVWHSDAVRELEETERKLRAVGDVMASFGVSS